MPPYMETSQAPRAKLWSDDDEEDEVTRTGSRPSSVDRTRGRPQRDAKLRGTQLLPPESFPRFSAGSLSDTESGRLSSPSPSPGPRQHRYHSSGTPGDAQGRMRRYWTMQWAKNKGVFLVAISQFFGSLMNLSARLLEHDIDGSGTRMNPFQILLARQGITAILCCLYMWATGVRDFPLGDRSVRGLLVARGLTGFFGIYGLWYSLQYLPLAEATVITFLAPSVAGYICHVLIHEPFTRTEQVASLVSLVGVALIARPASLFGGAGGSGGIATPAADAAGTASPTATALGSAVKNTTQVIAAAIAAAAPAASTQSRDTGDDQDGVTPAQRLGAIGVSLVGVLGAAGAYTTIRWIGKRAHPLVSVNYFSVWCVIVSTTVLSLAPVIGVGQPELRFSLPGSVRQWLLLLFLGTCGFIMQFMLTSGLGKEKSNRATMAIYTHMLFAAAFDRFIFGHVMSWLTLAGCSLIIGSAIWVTLTKNKEKNEEEGTADMEHAAGIEAVPILDETAMTEMDADDIHLGQLRPA